MDNTVFPLRVLIVDDHRMFREGIRARLEREPDIQVVGEAASAREATAAIEESDPTVVLLDIRLPDLSGIELARIFRQRWPRLKILILTGYDFDQYVRVLARIGVDGYMLKDAPQDTLIQALRDIAAGGAVLPPAIASKVIRTLTEPALRSRPRDLGELTVRELDVLDLLYQGFRNVQIGERLGISSRTVEAHVSSIMEKLEAQSRTDALRIALERKLIR